jgi:hypothetical protein
MQRVTSVCLISFLISIHCFLFSCLRATGFMICISCIIRTLMSHKCSLCLSSCYPKVSNHDKDKHSTNSNYFSFGYTIVTSAFLRMSSLFRLRSVILIQGLFSRKHRQLDFSYHSSSEYFDSVLLPIENSC